MRLPSYNNHLCYVNNINSVFHSFRCPNCDICFNRTFILERHLTTCKEGVKNVYPKNVYETQETLFCKTVFLGSEHTIEQTLFKNPTIFGFYSICVQEESFKDTDSIKWIGKHFSISVSISSNPVREPIFL